MGQELLKVYEGKYAFFLLMLLLVIKFILSPNLQWLEPLIVLDVINTLCPLSENCIGFRLDRCFYNGKFAVLYFCMKIVHARKELG